MGSRLWKSEFNRRDFLRGGAALGLGASAAWLAAACGVTSQPSAATSAGSSPTPLNYPKAQIDGDLNLFNWSQYMSQDVIDAFAKQYGVKVNTPYFDNMEDMLTKLTSGVSYD